MRVLTPARRVRTNLLVLLAVLGAALTALVVAAPARAAATVRTLHFAVTTGPDRSTECDIVGDLYVPAGADAAHPAPAILATNGFGGSKDDLAGMARAFSGRGYVVLIYSGLGFGGSGCTISLDDPDYDGVAGSQLVSFLGGADGIAYTDAAHTDPVAPLDMVLHDAVAHDQKSYPDDPRVGMIGGSYGGQIQFAVASVDPRVDTIVPMITWNDLRYSLAPNNTDQTTGVDSVTPGVTKLAWGLGFFTVGVLNGFQHAQEDPTRVLGCPNYQTWVCGALVWAGTRGHFETYSAKKMLHASVAGYLDRIRIPVLLAQGEQDTLFNLNESVATYQALKAQGTPVKLIWHSWGHSHGTPAPGELDLGAPDPFAQYETGRIQDWFDHYLKDSSVDTGPGFAYFRDWIDYSGNAVQAFGKASGYPVGSSRSFYLSGDKLVTSPLLLAPGSQSLISTPAGLPLNYSEPDAFSSYASLPSQQYDAPGTTASWQTAPLTSDLDVVGLPTVRLRVSAPASSISQAAGADGMLVLFVRLQDVAPDGTASDIRQQIAPVRIPDVTRPFTVTLPGIVHRFAAGHQVRLVVSSSSINYRGGNTTDVVTISSGSPGQVLKLPVVR